MEILERLVTGKSLLLGHAPVNGDSRKVLLDQQLGQSHATLNRFDENDHLIEFQNVK